MNTFAAMVGGMPCHVTVETHAATSGGPVFVAAPFVVDEKRPALCPLGTDVALASRPDSHIRFATLLSTRDNHLIHGTPFRDQCSIETPASEGETSAASGEVFGTDSTVLLSRRAAVDFDTPNSTAA
jgi:hypothetical protein